MLNNNKDNSIDRNPREEIHMKTIFFMVSLFVLNSISHAENITCPESITCEYEKGVCNAPNVWNVSGQMAFESFSDSFSIVLSGIGAFYSNENDHYSIICSYKYGNKPSSIVLVRSGTILTGTNWIFSGFGKKYAQCTDITEPVNCSAII